MPPHPTGAPGPSCRRRAVGPCPSGAPGPASMIGREWTRALGLGARETSLISPPIPGGAGSTPGGGMRRAFHSTPPEPRERPGRRDSTSRHQGLPGPGAEPARPPRVPAPPPNARARPPGPQPSRRPGPPGGPRSARSAPPPPSRGTNLGATTRQGRPGEGEARGGGGARSDGSHLGPAGSAPRPPAAPAPLPPAPRAPHPPRARAPLCCSTYLQPLLIGHHHMPGKPGPPQDPLAGGRLSFSLRPPLGRRASGRLPHCRPPARRPPAGAPARPAARAAAPRGGRASLSSGRFAPRPPARPQPQPQPLRRRFLLPFPLFPSPSLRREPSLANQHLLLEITEN